jgi:quercetin dioxygenase-like cupin family protein
MKTYEAVKAKALDIAGIIEYVTNSVVFKTIMNRPTGIISAVSCDTGEAVTEQPIPFDTFVQIIDGNAEIIIDGISEFLVTGQSIIIPAHATNIVKANERFKMIVTIIKSGHE